MRKQDVKPFVWGMVVGSIVLVIVIFSAGWVVTRGSADAQARQVASTAVLERLAPISVAQFMQDPNKETLLKEMITLDSWKRGDFVKEQGWARMPGEKESDNSVAVECARRIQDLKL